MVSIIPQSQYCRGKELPVPTVTEAGWAPELVWALLRKKNLLLTYLLTPCSTVLEKLTGSQLIKKFPHFMEPEVSIPQSQVPSNFPHPEPAQSSPYSHTPLSKDPAYYYTPIYARVSQVVSFILVSPPKPCIQLTSPPYALYAPPISFFSILSPEKYWVSSTDH